MSVFIARVAIAGEAEWSPTAGAVVGISNSGSHDVGYGATVATTYQSSEWLGVELNLSWIRYEDVFVPEGVSERDSGKGYNAMQFRLMPAIRVYPPLPAFWAHLFGEKLTPSIGLGAGYGLNHFSAGYRAFRGALYESASSDHLWVPLLAASVSLDYRPFEAFSLGARFTEVWALSADQRASHASEGSLYAQYVFYP